MVDEQAYVDKLRAFYRSKERQLQGGSAKLEAELGISAETMDGKKRAKRRSAAKKSGGAGWSVYNAEIPADQSKSFKEASHILEIPRLMNMFNMMMTGPGSSMKVPPITKNQLDADPEAIDAKLSSFGDANGIQMGEAGTKDEESAMKSVFPILQMDASEGNNEQAKKMVELMPYMVAENT